MATNVTARLDDEGDDVPRAAAKRIKRSAKCKPGESIPAGNAPAAAGNYLVEVALTVAKADSPPPPPPPPPPGGGKVFRENMAPRGKGGYGSPVLDLRQAKNWVFQGITIDGGGTCEQSLLHGECGDGVIFDGCTIKNFHPRVPSGGQPCAFVFPGTNWATSPDDYRLAFIGCHFENIDAEVFELKSSKHRIINCTFSKCNGGVRIRHGVGSMVANCPGLKIVKHRCGPHWSVNNPDAENWFYQGNLPGIDWEKLHEHGGGFNRQCAWQCQVSNCRSAIVGKEDGNAKGYLAEATVVPPAHPNVTLVPGGQKNTIRKDVVLPKERLVVAATREIARAMPLPPVADRTPAQVSARLKAMQEALLNPTHETQMRAEKTGHDDDEWWAEQIERALAA